MPIIDVGRSDFRRAVARSASIICKNRFFEQNPALNPAPNFPALIARPRLAWFTEIGDGPIRKTFDEPGTFEEATFAISGQALYKIETDGTETDLGDLSADTSGDPSMAATGRIETVPEFLFIADGALWVYLEDGTALGTLTASGAIANNDVVEIGSIYYKWTSGSVDTGTPAGTVGSPWLVALGASAAEALENLYHAINGDGEPAVTYSTALVPHTTVNAYSFSATTVSVSAQETGTGGNSITTTETGANIAWGGATLASGGTAQLRQIAMPDNVGAISVAYINSYVIVVPTQDNDFKGRFYWIEPGELYVDSLNYATAERSPDAGNQVIVFSDRFWILGQTTTEAWVTTGNAAAPMQRFTGVLYDRGVWEGTAVKTKDSMVLIDENAEVIQISGGIRSLTENRPDIVERIRRAMQVQAAP